MKKQVFLFLMVASLVLLMTSCADVQHVEKCLSGHQYGFWGGLWQGMIAPFACIGSLISDDIAVWAINNNGGWYTFGFILGIGSLPPLAYLIKENRCEN